MRSETATRSTPGSYSDHAVPPSDDDLLTGDVELDQTAFAFATSPELSDLRALGISTFRERDAWLRYEADITDVRVLRLRCGNPGPDETVRIVDTALVHLSANRYAMRNEAIEMVAKSGARTPADLDLIERAGMSLSLSRETGVPELNPTATEVVWAHYMDQATRAAIDTSTKAVADSDVNAAFMEVLRGDSTRAHTMLSQQVTGDATTYLHPAQGRWPILVPSARRRRVEPTWPGGFESASAHRHGTKLNRGQPRNAQWVQPIDGIHPWVIAAAARLHHHFSNGYARLWQGYLDAVTDATSGTFDCDLERLRKRYVYWEER